MYYMSWMHWKVEWEEKVGKINYYLNISSESTMFKSSEFASMFHKIACMNSFRAFIPFIKLINQFAVCLENKSPMGVTEKL